MQSLLWRAWGPLALGTAATQGCAVRPRGQVQAQDATLPRAASPSTAQARAEASLCLASSDLVRRQDGREG